jgi:hypothetical protein
LRGFLVASTEALIPTAHASQQVEPKLTYYQKHNVGQDQNQIIKYASIATANNLDFISTLEAENGLFSIDRVSKPNRNGTKDYGLCQLNSRYHSNFIKSADFKDYKKQIDYCWKVYQKRPTAFYGYYKREKVKSRFYLTTNE